MIDYGDFDLIIQRIRCIPSLLLSLTFQKWAVPSKFYMKIMIYFVDKQSVFCGSPTKISSLCLTSSFLHRTGCTELPEPENNFEFKKKNAFNTHK